MNEILIAKQIIMRIQKDNLPSNEVMRNYFVAHFCPRETRKIIQALVTKTFANWNVFTLIVKDCFPNIKEEEIVVLNVGLANTIFVKAFSDEETIEKVKEVLNVSSYQLSSFMIDQLLNHEYNRNDLVPSYIDRQSNEYYHLRYNIPLWLVEMWNRHYGRNISYRMIATLKQKPLRSFRVNDQLIKRRELIEKYPGELKIGVSETTVQYTGTRPLYKLDFYRRGEAFYISEGANHVINKMPLKSLDDVLVVASHHSSLPLAYLSRFKGNQKMLYALLDYDEVTKALKDISKYGLQKVNVIGSTLPLLLTYVSYPHDTVLVLPPSSNFQNIRSEYDFFTHFDRDQLDTFINTQNAYLEECAAFVKEGGHLVYIVETANNKEGSLQIKKFLGDHEEFVLMEERQMLPLDRRQSMCYFAFLKKESKKND